MNIFKATEQFESWLAKQVPLVRQDLALKHERMAEEAFSFFRATFYRWLQFWPEVCHDVAKAPAVLGVGDLHIENFGTWRDEEGRLIWGVNDLDEAWPAAYTLDLVRLVASSYLAIKEEHLSLSKREGAEAIEEGYRDGLAAGGKPFVLAEHHQWLRLLALGKLRDPVSFWEKMRLCPPFAAKPPAEVRRMIEESLPRPKAPYQSTDFGGVIPAGILGGAGSQGDSTVGVGVGQASFLGRSMVREAGGEGRPGEGSVREI
jgi:hypothetical protein